MRIRVLGAAAGGGLPQWNCGCPNCRSARSGDPNVAPQTQESVAVSTDGESWLLINASPEVRSQIEGFTRLHPRGPRHSPIAAIVLTNGDLDHSLGLLSLRESHPLVVYATDAVRRGFTEGNVLYRTLERFAGQVTWRTLSLGEQSAALPGLSLEPVAAPGKLPVHLEGRAAREPGENIGIVIRDEAGRSIAYFSATSAITPGMRAAIEQADCVFFDGTFWSSDELIALGLGTQRAEDMAHLPVGGERGSLAALAGTLARRRFYIHINNTNPLLRRDSAERQRAMAQGWEVAFDGMELTL